MIGDLLSREARRPQVVELTHLVEVVGAGLKKQVEFFTSKPASDGQQHDSTCK